MLASAGEATDLGEKQKHLGYSSMHGSENHTVGECCRRKFIWLELDGRREREGVLTGLPRGSVVGVSSQAPG